MKTLSLAALTLFFSAASASAAVDQNSVSYNVGYAIGAALLLGMIALVVIDILRKKGILSPCKEKPVSQKRPGKNPLTIFSIVLVLLTAAYVVSYLPRRSNGEYKFTKSGELRTDKNHVINDIQQWSPQGCWWQQAFREADGSYKSKGNSIGFIYAPLIAIDRRFNYPDLKLNRVGL